MVNMKDGRSPISEESGETGCFILGMDFRKSHKKLMKNQEKTFDNYLTAKMIGVMINYI